MKLKFTLFLMAFVCFFAQAQTVDEILDKYFENTGGRDKWAALNGVKMSAKINQGGMEIPFDLIQLKDGRQAQVISFQGKEIMQGVFDGTSLWSHNFMTMKAEKSDAETTENFKIELGSFPDPFLNYKSLGYKVELLGKETIDGAETFKIKLTKKPIKVDGVETDNVSYYYFDAENFVPLMQESEIKSGPAKGMISQIKMSDYQEVDGLIFPFAMEQGAKGQPGSPLTVVSISLNPAVDAKLFAFPEGN